MKRYLRYTLAFLLMGALISLQSCEDYFDLDENPNLVNNPPLPTLLSTTTQKTGLNSQRVGSITSFFVQYLASPVAGSSTDTYEVTDYTSTWDALYLAMADIYDMKQKAQEQEAPNYVGVANILMAYHLMLVTDLWGDAPYSEAFDQSTLTPKFDKQEELYNVILTLLDEAVTELSKNDSRVALSPVNDLIHNGNKNNWIKTAYALKARQLNKVSGTTAYNAQAVLAAVEKSYTSNADNADMGVFATINPWASVARNNALLILGGWLSEQLVEHLKGTTTGIMDPRLQKITDPTVTGAFIGTPNGVGNVGSASSTVKDEVYISLNSPITEEDAPLIIVSYPEVKMIEAEAAFRAGNRQRAYNAYLEGIRASMQLFEVSTAAANAYINSPEVSVGAANLTLNLIFKEKYVITYLNPEAWNDARRFDYAYAGFTLPVNAALNTFIRRVAYPQGEASKNPNTPETPPLSDPLWWDK
ncbi:SusD/RagB family nutrient-binding outer membrane lipoprotein [Pontibacter cellulosilyticus]|uniref:SusD/RagB family nutrient-binding outer membrane lipoprotein n=1 Tax=Pontibacter cellulosilyticus TaxID=1720253 RepID=A0A923N863_9BACT|nr:SusD/RagB family nutrient-binding outer membrane lipoprotein [Pontibacter cellulosilyticus]MBC5992240.1 SusD/RagB family nutrient-binding outer membrane lipoprotein [Pontibacter cellulosilyticus]